MTFVKAVWRFIVGVKDVLVLCFLLLFFAALYALLSLAPGERPVRTSEGALFVDLDGYLVEQPETADPVGAILGGEAPVKQYRLRDVIATLEAARADPKVKAVVLDLDSFLGGGQAGLINVGAALDRVRAAKKPVLAYGTIYDDHSYLLAAHSTEIWLNPLGGVALTGPGGSNLYFKGLLDKLGITMNIYRVGTFKSAVEPLMRTEQSPEARQAAQALASALWSQWRENAAKARPTGQIAAYAASPLPIIEGTRGDLSAAALRAGLVDKIGNRQDFEARVATLAGESPDPEGPGFAAIPLDRYARSHGAPDDGDIGVLTVAGDIVDGEAGPGTAGGESIAMLLEDALAKKDLKALVVRVDSPGGSVVASERIRGVIADARAQGLPVVVSMANVAASGGYWVATASDMIFAEPSTITGSIGVFGVLPSFQGLLSKMGITTDGVRTTPLSGQPDLLGGVSPEFSRVTQMAVEDIYRRFLALVSHARKMPADRVDRIAQGRVWDGGAAHQLGLVDRLGGLDDAIGAAAKLAKLDPATARPYYIEPKADPFTAFVTQMLESEENPASASASGDLLGHEARVRRTQLLRALQSARSLGEGGSVQALCLECAASSGITPSAGPGRRATNDVGFLASLLRILQ